MKHCGEQQAIKLGGLPCLDRVLWRAASDKVVTAAALRQNAVDRMLLRTASDKVRRAAALRALLRAGSDKVKRAAVLRQSTVESSK